MTTVSLKFKEDKNGEVTVRKVQHEIERIKLFQFMDTIKIVKEVLIMLNEQGSLIELLETAFTSDKIEELKLDEGIDEAKVEEIASNLDKQFVSKGVETFKELAYKLPEKFFELLSVLSGIKNEDLIQQDLFDVFDIIDAVFEVNDIEALIERVKKSLGATFGKLKFLQKVRKATAKL